MAFSACSKVRSSLRCNVWNCRAGYFLNGAPLKAIVERAFIHSAGAAVAAWKKKPRIGSDLPQPYSGCCGQPKERTYGDLADSFHSYSSSLRSQRAEPGGGRRSPLP